MSKTMATCDIKDVAPESHDVWSQIPDNCRQAYSGNRVTVLLACQCLNMGAEIIVPLYQATEAKSITDIEDFATVMPMPVAIYKREPDWRLLKVWRYSYAGDAMR